jgi:hypothetical protein
VNGVGVQREETRDGCGIPAFGKQHDDFGATQLSAVGGGVQELTQLPEFSGGGTASGNGAGHSRTSAGEGRSSIVPRVV